VHLPGFKPVVTFDGCRASSHMSVFFNPRRQFQYCSTSTVAKAVNDAA
jgi:hypothetical protein